MGDRIATFSRAVLEVGEDNKPSLRELLESLQDRGLKMYEIKLIFYREVRDMSFKEIMKKQGWLTERSAVYHFQKALKKLKESGIKV